MRAAHLILGILLVVLLVGCRPDPSTLSTEELQQLCADAVVCDRPYMRLGLDCCLDKNNNSICDRDDDGRLAPSRQELGEPAADDPGRKSSIMLTGGTINGQQVSQSDWTIQVSPGERISGQIGFAYENAYGTTMVFGATPTWGDRKSDYLTFEGLPTPGKGEAKATIRFTAPDQPGTYYIIFAQWAQLTPANMFSMTSWAEHKDVWDDGNDIVDWDEQMIEEGVRDGRVRATLLVHREYQAYYVPATAIRVIVE